MSAKKRKPKAAKSTFFHPSMWDTTNFVSLIDGMILLGLYTYGLAYLNFEVMEFKFRMNNTVHSILGLALGLLLVFRTNTAYDRWWEGRRIWGSLTNNSRNLLVKVSAFFPQTTDRETFSRLIPAFAFALKNHLRDIRDAKRLHTLTQEEKKELAEVVNIPYMLVKKMYELIALRNLDNSLPTTYLLSLDTHLKEFIEIMGACDRIRNTPIPKAYSIHLNQFLNLYLLSLPFSLLQDLGYWTVLVVAFMFYVLAGLKLIGEEIEDPFGKDSNDLPLENICLEIERSAQEILKKEQKISEEISL